MPLCGRSIENDFRIEFKTKQNEPLALVLCKDLPSCTQRNELSLTPTHQLMFKALRNERFLSLLPHQLMFKALRVGR